MNDENVIKITSAAGYGVPPIHILADKTPFKEFVISSNGVSVGRSFAPENVAKCVDEIAEKIFRGGDVLKIIKEIFDSDHTTRYEKQMQYAFVSGVAAATVAQAKKAEAERIAAGAALDMILKTLYEEDADGSEHEG